jgi:hypothetical protein
MGVEVWVYAFSTSATDRHWAALAPGRKPSEPKEQGNEWASEQVQTTLRREKPLY